MKYIVALDFIKSGVTVKPSCYIAPWSGDPGRTCREESAQRYSNISSANYALAHAKEYRDFKEGKILKVSG